MKSKVGISLIALIITIIVIIILAAIVIGTALTTPESANRAKFASNMAEVQHAVSIKLAENYNQFITNPDGGDLNVGFTRVSVNGAPDSFNSFALQGAETGTVGYLVRLDTIKMEPLTIGQEYKTATEVTFGTTDAFVYDAEGEVFYALGYKDKGKIYYSISDLEAGGVAVVNPSDENPSVEPSEEPQPSEEPEPVDPSLLAGVNIPVLGTGMSEVYWNGTTEVERGGIGFDVTNWYDYIAQSGDTVSGGTSRWANAKLNGSYFVWIPRYAYKITYYTTAAKTVVSGTKTNYGNIDVLFMYGTSSTKYIDKSTNTALDLPAGYIVHPAFTSDITKGGWDREITGIWVGKYKASRSNATIASAGSGTAIQIVPSVKFVYGLSIGELYSMGLQYNSTLESHMMKNSEWGAVAYLAHSKYGRNATEVTMNNNGNYISGYAGESISAGSSTTLTHPYNDTTYGVLASTTGNIYGVYDMKGGQFEAVAAYGITMTATAKGNGGTLVYIPSTTTVNPNSTKYATTYAGTVVGTNYKAGDATYETGSWNSDFATFIDSSGSPFFARSGLPGFGTMTGTFAFSSTNGKDSGGMYLSFHVCLIP
jgi:type II secretory pathway pseudopilin PulG